MMGFPGGSVVKNPPTNAGDMDLIPESGRSPGEGNSSGNLPGKFHEQRSLAGYSPWGGKESNTTKQLNKNNKAHYKPQFLLRVL